MRGVHAEVLMQQHGVHSHGASQTRVVSVSLTPPLLLQRDECSLSLPDANPGLRMAQKMAQVAKVSGDWGHRSPYLSHAKRSLYHLS